MQVFLAFELFTIGIIQLGLLIGIYHYQKSQVKVFSIRYWLISLLASALALLIYSAVIAINGNMAKPSFGITISNVFFYVSALAQTLFCISLTRDVSKRAQMLCAISVIVFACIFEYFRQLSNFEIRVLLMIFAGIVFYGLQVLEIKKLRRTNDSKQLKYLQFVTYLEFFFDSGRLPILLIGSIGVTNIDQVPQLLLMFTLLQLITNTLSYVAIGGYWAEQISFSNARTHIENTEMRALLAERDHMVMVNSRFMGLNSLAIFNSAIIHEISQPLQALNMCLDNLRVHSQSGASALAVEIKDAIALGSKVSLIVSSLRNMMVLNGDEQESVDIVRALDSIMPIISAEAREQKVDINQSFTSSEMVCLCNEVMLQRLLINLVANALDAFRDGNVANPTVSISVNRSMEANKAYAVISVSDNGQGFSPEELEHLFKPFHTSKANGMGVGLALSSMMVRKWGGRISAKNATQESGAIFEVFIPLVA